MKESLALVFAEIILRERTDFVLRKEVAVSYETKVDYWKLLAFSNSQCFRSEADCIPNDLELIKSECLDLAGGVLILDEFERFQELLKGEYETNSKNNEYNV